MTKQKLFQYAVIWHPNATESKEGMKSELLVEPTTVLADDQNALTMRAAMEIPQKYKDVLHQIEIVVRPF